MEQPARRPPRQQLRSTVPHRPDGVVETLLAAAADWGEDAGPDGPLSTMLFQLAEAFQELWVQHSQSLRLSVLESVTDEDDWEPVRAFVQEIRQRSLHRALPRPVEHARHSRARRRRRGSTTRPSATITTRSPGSWTTGSSGNLDRSRTGRAAEVVLQALVEHYDEYRDYNTTTTQSDYGENIHILLDFLRVKVRYDRYAWRLRPLALAHEVLCKRGNDDLAGEMARLHRRKDSGARRGPARPARALEIRHGVKLRTIRDRLEERFLLPLEIDQAVARVAPAAAAAQGGQGEDNPAFLRLRGAIEPLAENVSGVGLDVPAWVRRVEESLRAAKAHDVAVAVSPTDPVRLSPGLDFEELRRQLADWDRPLGE